MAIKFFKASPFYDQYLDLFYSNHLSLKLESYSDQYNQVMNDLFGWSDFWKLNLEKSGEFVCEEIILNNKWMQQKWAEENKISYADENWVLDILEQQLLRFQPDVFFAHDYNYITPAFLKKVKKNVKSIKLVIGWDGLWYNNLELYEEHDVILSCIEECANFYTKKGKMGFYFPFGFESTILDKLNKTTNPTINTSFIGSLFMGKGKHQERFNALSYIARKANLSLWANGLTANDSWKPLARLQIKNLIRGDISTWYNIWQLGKANNGPLFGLAMYQKLAESKISLNIHIDAAKNKAANMRLLEVTGVGACLLTDYKSNISDFFEPDKEIVTFKSKEEGVSKIKWLLENPNTLEEIAKAGHNRVLANYSFEARINLFISFLKKINF